MARPRRAERCLPQEGATPQRDAGAPAYHKRGRASPPLPDPRFAGPLVRRSGAPHSKELQRSHVPQKTCNPPCSELTIKVNVEFLQKVIVNHIDKVRNKRSTAGFRFNSQSLQ